MKRNKNLKDTSLAEIFGIAVAFLLYFTIEDGKNYIRSKLKRK